jgi:ABC-type maltose transport system permease subunit
MTTASVSRPAATSKVGSGQVNPNKLLFTTLRWVILIVGSIWALFPVVIIISAAFDPSNSVSSQTLFSRVTLDNFDKIFNDPTRPFVRWMFNSVYISLVSTILTLIICAFGAYALSRFRYAGRRVTMLTVLIVQVFPNLLAMVALYLFIKMLGEIFPLNDIGNSLLKNSDIFSQIFGRLALMFYPGLDSHFGLILIYVGGAAGFNTWLVKGYFDTVPRDLDESALVDGATQFQTFWMIILPLVRPILAVTAVLSFIGTFSDFLLAAILIKDQQQYTFAVGLSFIINGQYGKEWGVFAAGSLIGAIPIVILYLLVQRQIAGGLTAGAVKG